MNQKEAWFLSLLAMAYLYLDAAPARRPAPAVGHPASPTRRAGEGRAVVGPLPRYLPVRVVPRAVCPRDQLHPVAHRADGAIWCRGCDEAFYPQRAIWKAIMQPVAV